MNLDSVNLKLIGKVGSYVHYESRQYGYLQKLKRTYFKPVQPQTFPQNQRWLIFSAGVREWQYKTPVQKKVYEDRRKYLNLNMSGFNFFLSEVLKGNENMIKNVYRGINALVHGLNNITIPAVDTSKSVILYNSFLCSGDTPSVYVYGIEGAHLTSSTNIAVTAQDTAGIGTLVFAWQVLEFV